MIRIEDKYDDIFVQLMDFGKVTNVAEMVTPNEDGSYTIFVNARLTQRRQAEAVEHALRHIHNDDFQKQDVQQIEAIAHRVQTYQEKTKEETDLEKMIKKHRRAAARRAKRIAEYQKFVEWRMEVDPEYRKEHTIFY